MNGSAAPGPRLPEVSIRLAHIGLIVHRIDGAIALYRRLGLREARRVEFPQERIRIAFVPVGPPRPQRAASADGGTGIAGPTAIDEGARIELMETIEPAGPLHRFLLSRGEGIHHLALEVPDLDAALARVRDGGGRLIDQSPRPGSEGTRVAFIHPTSTHGVLIELVEHRGASGPAVDLP